MIVWMGICAFFFYSFIPAQTEFSTTKEVEDIDSTLAVIAYFNKHDTLVYWISEAEWSVNGKDTVRTSGVWTKSYGYGYGFDKEGIRDGIPFLGI